MLSGSGAQALWSPHATPRARLILAQVVLFLMLAEGVLASSRVGKTQCTSICKPLPVSHFSVSHWPDTTNHGQSKSLWEGLYVGKNTGLAFIEGLFL